MSSVVRAIKKVMHGFRFRTATKMHTFPKFKKLSYTDKKLYEELIKHHDTYSDFNFTSAHTWNVDGSHEYAIHNGNVILKLSDYNDGSPVLTVLGKHDVDETIRTVLSFNKTMFGRSSLKLVPHTTVEAVKNVDQFEIIEDENNHDHIFDLRELAHLSGNRFKNKRQAANRCGKKFNITFTELEETSVDIINHIHDFLERWSGEKRSSQGHNSESAAELRALMNVFEHFNNDPRLLLTMAYHKNELVGFSVDELLASQHVISHYFKTTATITGLSEHFNRTVATSLRARGYKYWNWEQDLGITSLRKMKLAYRPVAYNKKYVVKMRCE